MQPGRSESAIMTSAAEGRYRIDRPNSRPRTTRIIALDDGSQAALAPLQGEAWNDARFLRYLRARNAGEHLPSLRIDAILRDADGNEVSLMQELSGADTVIMVTRTRAAEAAEIIGNACAARGIAATGLVLVAPAGEATLGDVLSALRPHTTMLVVSHGADYLADMLAALRA